MFKIESKIKTALLLSNRDRRLTRLDRIDVSSFNNGATYFFRNNWICHYYRVKKEVLVTIPYGLHTKTVKSRVNALLPRAEIRENNKQWILYLSAAERVNLDTLHNGAMVAAGNKDTGYIYIRKDDNGDIVLFAKM